MYQMEKERSSAPLSADRAPVPRQTDIAIIGRGMTGAITTADIVIVGAGITGAVTAWALAEEGVSVAVIERYHPAAMASGWTLAGVRQSGRDPAELPLALKAVSMWTTLDERLGADTGYRQGGNLRLARSPEEVETIRGLVESQRAAGLGLRLVDNLADVRDIAPVLSERVLAASFCPSDGHADPVATVNAFRAAAERRGARFYAGVGVERLETRKGHFTALETTAGRVEAGACLVAAGIQVNTLLEPLGLAIPLRRPMVTVVQTAPLPPMLTPVLGVANANMAARQQADGRLRVTSGAGDWSGVVTEQDGMPAVQPPAMAVADTVRTVSEVLPDLAQAPLARVWAGLLDLTPDALPVLDHAPGVDNLIVAGGFSGHGFGIGPATGLVLRDLLLERRPSVALDAFRFDRFSNMAVKAPLTLHG